MHTPVSQALDFQNTCLPLQGVEYAYKNTILCVCVDDQFFYNTINIMSLEFTPTPYTYLATITNNNTEDKQNIRWEVRFVSSSQEKPFI
jgi:hypothetical protein